MTKNTTQSIFSQRTESRYAFAVIQYNEKIQGVYDLISNLPKLRDLNIDYSSITGRASRQAATHTKDIYKRKAVLLNRRLNLVCHKDVAPKLKRTHSKIVKKSDENSNKGLYRKKRTLD